MSNESQAPDVAKLLQGTEERTAGYVRKWLQIPAFRAALHRQGRPGGGTRKPAPSEGGSTMSEKTTNRDSWFRVRGFDLAAARARLAAYRSILADLDETDRRAAEADDGPEAAGIPGAWQRQP